MITLTIAFAMGEKVRITELQRDGRVVGIFVGDSGIQYNVRYFDNAEARTIYFFECELQTWTPS